ncbi:unnamed protein product [Albugo candida]|uniref:Uncharacterized protein n=1 Tax=Albugo candida TaxID=65357 RepID=A0A024G3E8_9STRA|nr:unnamed protein product [Albugo candida]|eukprot:CCI41285.1 unnamed protein product [Albugo candida]
MEDSRHRKLNTTVNCNSISPLRSYRETNASHYHSHFVGYKRRSTNSLAVSGLRIGRKCCNEGTSRAPDLPDEYGSKLGICKLEANLVLQQLRKRSKVNLKL